MIKRFFWLAWLAWTWALCTYHVGAFHKPQLDALAATEDPISASRFAHWIDKSQYGIHQLILTGSPYERGLAAGGATKELLRIQEREMITQLNRLVPGSVLQRLLELGMIRWFSGIDRFFEPWMLEEMYGVSRSTSHEYDYLGDGFTRQIAYHGVHEIGQMMVDQGGDNMGCTVIAVPWDKAWVIGRNFDFEAGRIFDTEKIMKWVFPEKGHAYVSVAWAGMVGAVTAVNNQGVYISLNAAGTRDSRRYGTPSTLVLLKAVQFSTSAEEAVSIIKGATMFITDIFVVSDRKTGRLFRVEKSPRRTEVIPLNRAAAITNHLIAPVWRDDPVNQTRMNELTSKARSDRAEKLLARLAIPATDRELELQVLGLLRDKGEKDGKALHLGNRLAIDPLIAAHSVLFNAAKNVLYVSRGPAVSGAFVGFDLTRSFENQRPVLVDQLPGDVRVSPKVFSQVRSAAKAVSEAETQLKRKDCEGAHSRLQSIPLEFREAYYYYSVQGDYRRTCLPDSSGAREDWLRALELGPAYERQVRQLKERLGR